MFTVSSYLTFPQPHKLDHCCLSATACLVLYTRRLCHAEVTRDPVRYNVSLPIYNTYQCSQILLLRGACNYELQASGNKVSRQTVLCGSQNIVLSGKVIVQSDAIIRGDLANVRAGRYCIISKHAVIRPPFKKFSKG